MEVPEKIYHLGFLIKESGLTRNRDLKRNR